MLVSPCQCLHEDLLLVYLHMHSVESPKKEVKFIFQVILLSATMPADVLEVTKRFMREPIRILVKKEELTLEGIRQFYIEVEQEVNMRSGLLHI